MVTLLPAPIAGPCSDAASRPACTDVVYVRGLRVDVPAGFQLAKGPVRPGDRYLSYTRFLRSGGAVILWLPAERFVAQRVIADVEPERAADGFAMLIRPVAEAAD